MFGYDAWPTEDFVRQNTRICDAYEAVEEGNAADHYRRTAIREGLVWASTYRTTWDDHLYEGEHAACLADITENAWREIADLDAITFEEFAALVKSTISL